MDNTLLIQLVLPVIILQVILLVTALISLKNTVHTNGPKWLWILIILFVNIVGPVAFFIFGKRGRRR